MRTEHYVKQDEQHKTPEKSKLNGAICLWIDGKTYWMQSGKEKLIVEEHLSITIKEAFIHSKIRFYYIYVTNHSPIAKRIKLIMMHQYEKASRDHFAFVSPTEKVIFHLADQSVYLVNGCGQKEMMTQCTVQSIWNIQGNLFWKSLYKGTLQYQPMAKGTAASLYSLNFLINGKETGKGCSWVISGSEKKELIQLNKAVISHFL
ncbi:hypothetical protein J9303_08850 [Bacillaceae bacterium Marseille-Q3522]|nr:hypothetical protein [Bacillaceae bacterium Marseille-Q3522]